MKKLHIIYIPGLGGHYDRVRRWLLSGWRIFGVTTQLVPMKWRNNESYEEKVRRVEHALRTAPANRRIVLLGESAGGSIVLAAYAKYGAYLYKAATICGKNTNPANVSPVLYTRNPAFKTAMHEAVQAAARLPLPQRQSFISFYPFYDGVVPVRESFIADCQKVRLFSIGHFFTVFLGLTLLSGFIIQVLKRR